MRLTDAILRLAKGVDAVGRSNMQLFSRTKRADIRNLIVVGARPRCSVLKVSLPLPYEGPGREADARPLRSVIAIAAGTFALSVVARATVAGPPQYNRGYNDCLALVDRFLGAAHMRGIPGIGRAF